VSLSQLQNNIATLFGLSIPQGAIQSILKQAIISCYVEWAQGLSAGMTRSLPDSIL